MTSTAAPHVYVQSDLADGESLVDWRRRRRAGRPAAHRRTFRDLVHLHPLA